MKRGQRLKLGVNIDHVATIRQARQTPYPDLVTAARLAVAGGGDGITIHLREDRRHIQTRDVFALKEILNVPLNLEMANHPDIVRVALRARPEEVCLVPERREELTTEGGLDASGQFRALYATVQRLRDAGCAVSLFIAPDPRQIEAAVLLGAPCIELHTGHFCDSRGHAAKRELRRLIHAAGLGHAAGLTVNAGHGIHYGNIGAILRIPHLDTLNIGHSIVARALFVGIKAAVREMRRALAPYRA